MRRFIGPDGGIDCIPHAFLASLIGLCARIESLLQRCGLWRFTLKVGRRDLVDEAGLEIIRVRDRARLFFWNGWLFANCASCAMRWHGVALRERCHGYKE